MGNELYTYDTEKDRWVSPRGGCLISPKLIEIEQMDFNALWKIKFLIFISKLLNVKIIANKKEKWRHKGIIYDTINGEYVKKKNINLSNLHQVHH